MSKYDYESAFSGTRFFDSYCKIVSQQSIVCCGRVIRSLDAFKGHIASDLHYAELWKCFTDKKLLPPPSRAETCAKHRYTKRRSFESTEDITLLQDVILHDHDYSPVDLQEDIILHDHDYFLMDLEEEAPPDRRTGIHQKESSNSKFVAPETLPAQPIAVCA